MPTNPTAILRHVQRMVGTQPDTRCDAVLLECFARQADESAFAALVQRHGPLVWSVSRRATRHEQDAEDVYQATFLVLARQARAIHKTGSVRSFLYGVAYRLAQRARCDAARRRRLEQRAAAAPTTAADDMTWRELREVLDEELARLPDKYRAPLLLCYFDELTHEEAARQLGWSKRSLRDRLERGRDRLRARLIRRGVTLSMTLAGSMLAGGLTGAAAPRAATEGLLRAAGPFAARRALEGMVSAGALALAEGGLRTIFLGKLALVAAALVAMVVLGSAGFVGWRAPEAVSGAAAGDRPGIDCSGDPLPPGAVARLGTERFRFWPLGAMFLPDGKTIVSVTQGNAIEFWDARSGRFLREIDTGLFSMGQGGTALSHDGKRFAVNGTLSNAGMPGTQSAVRVYELPSGKVLRTFERDPLEGANAIALTADGKLLFTLDRNGKMRIEEVATGAELLRQQFPGDIKAAIALSPDGSTLAVASGPNSRKLFLWKWQNADEPRAIASGSGSGWNLAFSPDGKLLAECGFSDRKVRVFDVASGRLLHRLELPDPERFYHDHVAFTPDGKLLAASGKANQRSAVDFWNPLTGKFVRRLDLDEGALAFSPDGSLLLAGARVWDLAGGKELSANDQAHRNQIERIITGKDLVVTASDDNTVRLWDAASSKQRQRFVHGGDVRGIALSPDESRLVSVSMDDSVCLWDVATGKRIYRLPGHGKMGSNAQAAVFLPDGKSFLTWAGTDMNLRKWEVGTGKAIREQTIRPTGVRVPSEDDEPAAIVMHPAQGAAFTPDARRLILLAGIDHRLFVFDAATGAELRSFPSAGTSTAGLAISPDSKLVLTCAFANLLDIKLPSGTMQQVLAKEHPVAWWDVGTGTLQKQIRMPEEWAGPVAFAPDGKLFATASWERRAPIYLLETASGRVVRTVEGFRGVVRALAFLPDGKRLVSGMDDGSALVWDLTRER
jgi:RNA polymerase sigma factor (sigma-70 family)